MDYAEIGVSTLSDHSHVSASFHLTVHKQGRPHGGWTKPFSDPLVLEKLKALLDNFFARHANSPSTPLDIWEVHKCIIRGELITLGLCIHRKRGKTRNELMAEIARLEQWHKQSLDAAVSAELEQAHSDLRATLEASLRYSLFYKTKFFFMHGKRNSKFLANYLCSTANTMAIHSIRGPQDQTFFTSSDIAQQFHSYYEQLYQCQRDDMGPNLQKLRKENITTFLAKSQVPSLHEYEADLLKTPFTKGSWKQLYHR